MNSTNAYPGTGVTKLIAFIAMLQAHLQDPQKISFRQAEMNKLVPQIWVRLLEEGYTYGIPHSVNIPGIKELIANRYLESSLEFRGGFMLPSSLLQDPEYYLQIFSDRLYKLLAKRSGLAKFQDLQSTKEIRSYLETLLNNGDSKDFAYIAPFILLTHETNLRIYILSHHTAADRGVDFIAFKVPPAKFQFIIGQVKKYRLTIRHFAQELWKITNCDAYWFIAESVEAKIHTQLQNQSWYKDLPYAELEIFEKKDLLNLLSEASDNQIQEIVERINDLVQRDLQQIKKRLEVTKKAII